VATLIEMDDDAPGVTRNRGFVLPLLFSDRRLLMASRALGFPAALSHRVTKQDGPDVDVIGFDDIRRLSTGALATSGRTLP
jgi:hypothetical protein